MSKTLLAVQACACVCRGGRGVTSSGSLLGQPCPPGDTEWHLRTPVIATLGVILALSGWGLGMLLNPQSAQDGPHGENQAAVRRATWLAPRKHWGPPAGMPSGSGCAWGSQPVFHPRHPRPGPHPRRSQPGLSQKGLKIDLLFFSLSLRNA